MSVVRRLREWRRDLLTPDHVEKASWRERVKRTAWLLASTFATLVAVFLVGGVVAIEYLGEELGIVVAFLVWVYVDYRVGIWGIQYFDLTPPWQFRDAEAKERETA